MRKFKLVLLLFALASSVFGTDGILNEPEEKQIVLAGTGLDPRLVDEMPIATYRTTNRMLSIEFPSADFEPYTLTVETVLTTQEYYVTTPFVSQYISPDVVNVNLYLETDGGDLYWGSFEATSTGSME